MENSHAAISDGVYEISGNLEKSGTDLIRAISAHPHAPVISEIKFASPSLGKIRTPADPATVAKEMASGGACAISVLTQPHLFGGSPENLMRARKATSLPILMKDVMVDTVQIDAAQKMGADYILLIQSLFDGGHLAGRDEMIRYGHKRGLGVLLEAHTGAEFERAQKSDADLLGINNRNLDTLEIDLSVTEEILSGYDGGIPVISESGICAPHDIQRMKRAGACAFLVGSSIMKTDNIREGVKKMVNSY